MLPDCSFMRSDPPSSALSRRSYHPHSIENSNAQYKSFSLTAWNLARQDYPRCHRPLICGAGAERRSGYPVIARHVIFPAVQQSRSHPMSRRQATDAVANDCSDQRMFPDWPWQPKRYRMLSDTPSYFTVRHLCAGLMSSTWKRLVPAAIRYECF